MDIHHGCTVPLRWIISESSSAARAMSTRDSQSLFEFYVAMHTGMSWTCHAATQSLATIKVQLACTVCTVCTVSFHLSVNVRVVVSRRRILHTGTVLCREASHKHLNRARHVANIVTIQSCPRCASVVQRARPTLAWFGVVLHAMPSSCLCSRAVLVPSGNAQA